jgi:hypothetical protein
MPAIQIGNKIGPLTGRRRQLRGGNQAAPEHFLLVLTVKQQQSREQILDVPEQIPDFTASLAFAGRHPFPPRAKTA